MLTRTKPADTDGRHIGVLFVASPLFSEAAAAELITRTGRLMGEGGL